MEDDKDPPIIPEDFCGGVRVVDIGDLRVARGMSRRPFSGCHHKSLRYDSRERRIWCPDCEKNIDPFDAFENIVGRMDGAISAIRRREDAVRAAEEHSLVSRAAKAIDKTWRSHAMAPACPHCREALLPEDFSGGVSMSVSRELARAKRKAKAKPA